jgi:hypothetical protein
METDGDLPAPLTQEAARLLGMITAWTIALRVAVKANPRVAELHGRIDGVREAARAQLGNFKGQPAFEGIEVAIRDFEQALRGLSGPAENRPAGAEIPADPIDGIGWMVGTITGLQGALRITVETNPQAARLRDRLEAVREAAIAHVIGEDVVDDVFEGIDYTMDELDELLPRSSSR